jgi:hypothetical protein
MNEVYQIVRQKDEDRDYFTIFNSNEQYCDEDGNPIRYANYNDAKFECDMLNETERR